MQEGEATMVNNSYGCTCSKGRNHGEKVEEHTHYKPASESNAPVSGSEVIHLRSKLGFARGLILSELFISLSRLPYLQNSDDDSNTNSHRAVVMIKISNQGCLCGLAG